MLSWRKCEMTISLLFHSENSKGAISYALVALFKYARYDVTREISARTDMHNIKFRHWLTE